MYRAANRARHVRDRVFRATTLATASGRRAMDRDRENAAASPGVDPKKLP
jgi:hypothetical protein